MEQPWLSSAGSSCQSSLVTQRNSWSFWDKQKQALLQLITSQAQQVQNSSSFTDTWGSSPKCWSHLVPKNTVQMLLDFCHKHYKSIFSLSLGSDTPRKPNSEQHQGNAEGGFKASRDLTKQKYAKKPDRTINPPLLQDVCFGSLNNFTWDSIWTKKEFQVYLKMWSTTNTWRAENEPSLAVQNTQSLLETEI